MQYGGPCMQGFAGLSAAQSSGASGSMAGDPGIKHFGFRRYKRMNVLSICLSLFVPWLVFDGILALLSFGPHYHFPVICDFLVVGVVAVLGFLWAISIWRRVAKTGQGSLGNPIDFVIQLATQASDQAGDWYFFLLTTTFISALAAVALGNGNFWSHTQPYYDLSNLSVYTAVNPATVHGQELMDAGQVTYTPGTTLDVKRSVGFRNTDTYCVAPIVPAQNMPLASYDFWAVGLNCCSDSPGVDFKCGATQSITARGGLRVMRNEDRAFYRLAVQQAQSTYNIRATHPLFFYWVDDPALEQYSYMQEAFRQYLMAMYVHFGVQLLLVCLAAAAISNGGGAA